MKRIEDLFKTGLENFEVGLPEGDWEDFQKASAAGRPKKASGTGLFKYLVPAAIALSAALFFLLLPDNNAPENVIEIVTPSEPAPVTAQVVEPVAENIDTEISFSESHSGTRSGNGKSSLDAMAEDITTESASSEETGIGTPPSNDPAPDTAVEQDEMTADQAGDEGPEETGIFVSVQEPSYSINNVAEEVNHKKGKISVGKIVIPISTIAVAGTSALLSGGVGMMGANAGDNKLADPGESSLYWRNNIHSSQLETTEEAFPIVAGASVKFQLTPRWSLVSGVDYSLRKIKYISLYEIPVNHKVHYLGIPIRADYSYPLNRHFDIYAGAGVKLDLCIASKMNYAVYSTEKGLEIFGSHYYNSPARFGLLACCGVQFNLIDELGIYLEPNAAYFFSGSNPKLMLSMNTGIRYTPKRK